MLRNYVKLMFSSFFFYFPRFYSQTILAQSAGAAEHTDCISEEEKDSPNKCPRYDTKKSDGKASLIVNLWGIRSTTLLPILFGSLWPRVKAPDRILSRGQIELNCVLL